MRLTSEQQASLRDRGICANETCDRCDKILGDVRYTRRGEQGEWCSELCRDGVVIDRAARRNLRKRTKQAATMKRLTRTPKTASLFQTIQTV